MNVTDIDECASSPCADGETCVDGVDGYECDMGHHGCGSGTVDYHFKGPVVYSYYRIKGKPKRNKNHCRVLKSARLKIQLYSYKKKCLLYRPRATLRHNTAAVFLELLRQKQCNYYDAPDIRS